MKKNFPKTVIIGAVLVFVSGCGSIIGVRHFEVWKGGPSWDFMEGQDFHIGANGIDNVDDRRGVSSRLPKKTAQNIDD